MINCIIGNNLSRKSIIIDENTVIKEALRANNIDYNRGVTTLDGATLSAAEMNSTFAQMGITTDCALLNVVKADNAAKISVKAGVAFLQSAMKLDDIKKLMKYDPAALTLKDKEGKNVVFAVGATAGAGNVNKYGVSFGENTTKEGYAVVTMQIPANVAKPEDYVMELVGSAVLDLGTVETQAAAALTAVSDKLAKIKDTITVE